MFNKSTNIHIPNIQNVQLGHSNQENWKEEFNSQHPETQINHQLSSKMNVKQNIVPSQNASKNAAETHKTAENINKIVLNRLDSKLSDLHVKEPDDVVNQNLWNAANDILSSQDARYLNNTEFIKFVKQIKNREIELLDNEFIQKLPFKESDYVEDFDLEPHTQPILEQGFDSIKADLDQWSNQYEQNLKQGEELTNSANDAEWTALNKDYMDEQGYVDNSGYGYTFDQVRHRYPPYKFNPSNDYLINARQDPKYIEELYNIDSSMNESIKALEAAVQLTNDAFSWYSLGLRHYENEHDMHAIYALRKCVEREPLRDAYATLAVVYTNENFRLDAFDAISKWLDLTDAYKDISVPKSSRLDDDIYSRIIKCLELNPSDAELNMMMGVLCHLRNELPKSVECFKSALARKQNDHKLWNMLGATYANSQQTELAREAYFKALDIHPSFIRARYNLAIACISENNYSEAAEHVLQSLKMQQQENQPTSESLWSTLKMACLMLNRPDLVTKCEERELQAFKAEFVF
eukprot:NODE_383_length_9627_cov_0.480793.p2 type:complete len:522 gc:universal NODE_383_length_9627_cov_0.480793:6054-7619(+)